MSESYLSNGEGPKALVTSIAEDLFHEKRRTLMATVEELERTGKKLPDLRSDPLHLMSAENLTLIAGNQILPSQGDNVGDIKRTFVQQVDAIYKLEGKESKVTVTRSRDEVERMDERGKMRRETLPYIEHGIMYWEDRNQLTIGREKVLQQKLLLGNSALLSADIDPELVRRSISVLTTIHTLLQNEADYRKRRMEERSLPRIIKAILSRGKK